MDFDTTLWDEIQDAPGEIYDLEDYYSQYEDDQALEYYSLCCAYGEEF